jgi:DNA-binding beta-propeller fold protein YncE
VFPGAVTEHESPGGSTFTLTSLVRAEVRGATTCDRWSFNVQGPGGGLFERPGGAAEGLTISGPIGSREEVQLTATASCVLGTSTISGTSEASFATGPATPDSEPPSGAFSYELAPGLREALTAVAANATRVAVLTCTRAGVKTRQRLGALRGALCKTAAWTALVATDTERDVDDSESAAVAPAVAVPRLRRQQVCRALRGRRACGPAFRATRTLVAAERELTIALHPFARAVDVLEDSPGRSQAAIMLGAAGATSERAARAVATVGNARSSFVAVLRRPNDIRLRGRRLKRAVAAFRTGRSLPRAVRSEFTGGESRRAARHLRGVRRLRLSSALRTALGEQPIAAQSAPVEWAVLLRAVEARRFSSSAAGSLEQVAESLRRRAGTCDVARRSAYVAQALRIVLDYRGQDDWVLHWLARHTTPPLDTALPKGCPSPRAARPGIFAAFGGFGTAPGQFDRPTDVSVGPAGIYVADQANSRIQQFTYDGRFVRAWGGRPLGDVPPADGQFLEPVGVALDAAGNVYVSDFRADQVQKFTADGQFLTKWGTTGSGDGQFMRVSGIAIGPQGNVYVVDPGNARVQIFDQTGAFLGKFGSAAAGPGRFQAPRGITTDAAGNVYVAERNLGHVVVFDAGGTFVREFGNRGLEPGAFDGVYDVAVDRQGELWIADYSNYRLQEFTPAGQHLRVVGTFGASGESFNPWAVATDPAGNVYVADIIGTGDRVLVFGGLG